MLFAIGTREITWVFRVFLYGNAVKSQNTVDIRNQHKKLHRITYILSKNNFRQNSTVLPLSSFLLNFALWSPTGRILTKIIF
jgi:hypothetical protein